MDDLEMFVSKVLGPEAVSPFIILAHSMGGHIALRYIHDHPGIVDRAVLVSPMIDILTSPFSGWLVRFLTRAAAIAGLDHAYISGSGDYADEEFEGNRLTSDPVRFMDEKKQ